jgi:hypothetical protein
MYNARKIAQFSLGLIAAIIIAGALNSNEPQWDHIIVILGIIFFVNMMLGSWHPSSKHRFVSIKILPSDTKESSKKYGFMALAAFSGYMLWYTYASPERELMRRERTIDALFGHDGVLLLWLFVSIASLIYVIRISIKK